MQGRHRARACTLLGLVVLVLSSPARGQQPAPDAPGATQPPAEPDAAQPPATEQPARLAAVYFAEGAALFKRWRFEEAEQRFREALKHRDHPLIHLYLSRALDMQGRLVEAYAALQPALRPGGEPLPAGDVQVAEDLRQKLESRLAQIEVSCDVPGAEVSLDGEPWFTAPGWSRRMITAGQHVLMARKPGYFAVAAPVSLIPGKRTRMVLRMTADVAHVERRWPRWQPRAVVATGIVIALAGGVVLWQASGDYAAIGRELGACKPEDRCEQVPQRRLDRAEWKNRIGTGALIAGGSVLAAGLAGMVLNLPRSRRSEPGGGLENLRVAPVVSGDAAGISVQLGF